MLSSGKQSFKLGHIRGGHPPELTSAVLVKTNSPFFQCYELDVLIAYYMSCPTRRSIFAFPGRDVPFLVRSSCMWVTGDACGDACECWVETHGAQLSACDVWIAHDGAVAVE